MRCYLVQWMALAGILPLRCCLLYGMGRVEPAASELFFGAFGHPDVVSMRVELKQVRLCADFAHKCGAC